MSSTIKSMKHIHIVLSSDPIEPSIPGFDEGDRKDHQGANAFTGPIDVGVDDVEVTWGTGISAPPGEVKSILLESRCEDGGASSWKPVGGGWYACAGTYSYEENLAAWIHEDL